MAGVVVTSLLGLGTLLLVILAGFYVYVKNIYRYFEKRGIPFDKPVFPFGSLTSSAKLEKPFWCVVADLYAKHKAHKVIGFFSLWKKQILINDPAIIKLVLVKDFDVFQSRGIYFNKEKDPLQAHLFSLEGDDWKFHRTKLTPTFTSGKIKGMFASIACCVNDMVNAVDKLQSRNGALDCQMLFCRYGLAVISSTAFGLESDALTNEDSMFVAMSKKMFEPSLERIMTVLLFFNRELAKTIDRPSVPRIVSEYFMGLTMDTVKYRKDNGLVRNDFLQLLIQLTDSEAQGSNERFTDKEICAEAFVFILAGAETTSNTMSFCLYELTMNPEVQQRVLTEVDSLQEITYDSVNSLEYLDMVLDEALRKYPPLGFLNRECTRDYEVPGSHVVIEKGTQVFVSSYGLHHDPELFPDPELFIPERFSKDNKAFTKPYTYLPFGEGPRGCIGKRFSKITMKVGLAILLRNFQVERTPSTPQTLPMEPRSVIITVAGGLWLRLVHRTPLTELRYLNIT